MLLDQPKLVFQTTANVSGSPTADQPQGETTNTAGMQFNFTCCGKKLNLLTCHLYMQQLYKDRGFSEKATSIILQSWHQSSQKQCDGHIRKWRTGCSFCSQRQVDQIHPTVGVAVEFLTRLYKNGLSCSSINSERSALSEILNQTHFSQWVMVSILMLTLHERYVGPLCLVMVRRGMLTWFSSTLVPLKLVMLVALTTAQRSQSIHLLDTMGVV